MVVCAAVCLLVPIAVAAADGIPVPAEVWWSKGWHLAMAGIVAALLLWNFVLRGRMTTERARVCESTTLLEETTAFYAALLRTAAEGVIVQDAQGHIQFCNPAAAAALGRAQGQLIDPAGGDWLAGAVCEDGTPLAAENTPVARALATGEPQRGVVVGVTRPDGERVWICANSDVVAVGAGQPVLVMTTFADVSERFRMVDELHTTSSTLETVMRNLPGTVFRLFYPNEGEKCVLFADGMPVGGVEWSQVPRDSEFFKTVFHPDDIELLYEEVPRRLRECGQSEHTFRFLLPDGRTMWLHAWERVVEQRADGYVTAGMAIDVTREVENRLALEQSQQRLRETSGRLDAVVDNLPGVAFRMIYTPDGQIRPLYVSAGCHEYLGASPEELCSWDIQSLRVFNSPPSPAVVADHYRQLAETGRYEGVQVYRGRNGQHFHMLVRSRMVAQDGENLIVDGIAIDISGRIRAENELRATSERMEALIANLPGSIARLHYYADDRKRMLYVDGGAIRAIPGTQEQLLGASPEELLELFHPEDRHRLFHEVPAELRATGECIHEFREFMPGGETRWFRAREKVISRNGDEMIAEALVLDVTEEIAARQARQDSDDRYREMVESVNAVTWEFDMAAGVFTYVSPQAVALSGYSLEEWLQPGFWAAHIHADDRDFAVNYCMSASLRGEDHDFEYRMVKADGQPIWLRDCVHVQTRDGELYRLRGVMFDITERKSHEQGLERINRVLRTMGGGKEALVHSHSEPELLSQMCQAIVGSGSYRMAWIGMADDGGMETLRVVAHAGHEDGFFAAHGGAPRDVAAIAAVFATGRPHVAADVEDMFTDDPWMAAAAERGYRASIVLPLQGASGVFGCLAIHDGEPDSFASEEIVAFFVDLADNLAFGISAIRERQLREEMELQLSQIRKMEALGQLAGSVAHDFNNLLGAILGFAQFVQEDSASTDPRYFHAARIVAASKRGKALIGQILSFSRRGDLKREGFLVAEMVEEIIALLSASIPAATAITSMIADGPMVVEGDRDQLGQVLFNLIINAHDALEGDPGKVLVELRPTWPEGEPFRRLAARPAKGDGAAEVWCDAEGCAHAVMGSFDGAVPHISLVVGDTGCGMDTTVLQRMFTPFFTTKEKGHGTGLGMAIVQNAVQAHGGAILVRSRPNAGTSIEVVLPASDVSILPPAETIAALPSMAVAGGRVMLVDDDADFSEMLLAALERAGYEVTPYGDPREALADMREHVDAWDAVVADQTMPHMSGIDMIREMRGLRPGMPCILCTGYALENLDDAKLKAAGVRALFRKPLEVAELLRVLAVAVDESKHSAN